MKNKAELGQEYIQPNEEKDIQQIITFIRKRLERDYPPGKTLRQFHAKMHGLVRATFKVNDDLPANFQHGFLVAGKSYEAWIRYSNGGTKPVHDKKGDVRGMAIKLLNVEGEMLVEDEVLPKSQDFLLITYPTLMSPDVASFRASIKAITQGTGALVLYALNPVNWLTIYRTLKAQMKFNNLFAQQYWSIAPSRLGTADQAVKYSAIPKAGKTHVMPKEKDANFLKQVMKEELAAGPVEFDFCIQLQEDAEKQPIENACIEWKTPWQKVAGITIENQDFDTDERRKYAEHLSFSPWHCVKENQPLAGISRARKEVYKAISDFRLSRNGEL